MVPGMKKFKFEIEMEVADVWVEDGFDPSEEVIEDVIKNNMLVWADGSEFKVKVKKMEAVA